MNHITRHFVLTAGVLAASLLVAACGGGEATGPADATPPTVIITDSEAGTNATGPVTFTFKFSEDVGTSFTAEDIVVTGGTAGAFTRVSGTEATLVVTPVAGATGKIVVSVAANKFSDAAANGNTATASAEQAYAPAVVSTALVTFDETPAPTVHEFGGALSTVEAGPAGGTGLAFKITRPGGEVWAGGWVATPTMPFAANRKTVTARVYSPTAGVQMVAKAEYAENTGTGETTPTTAVVAGWQTLTWVFNNVDLSKTYNRFVILPNLGTVGTGQAYYVDDITVAPEGPAVVEPPAGVDTVLATFDEATPPLIFEFGGAGYAIEAGPTGGTANALKITRPGGEPYAGAYVATAAIPFSTTRKTITARVYSTTAGVPMVAKAEYAENAGTGDTTPTTPVVVGWQTLTWVFSNVDLTKTYTRFTILPNLGTVGTGQSYYFDDIKLLASAGVSGAMSYIAQPFVENLQSAYDTLAGGKARTGNYETGSYSAAGMTQWWGGAFKSKIQIGYGVSKADTSQSYFGLYIKHGGAGWDIAQATKYTFSLGTNGECISRCTANVRLVSSSNANCVADIKVKLDHAELTAFSKNLADFTVAGCTTNTMAAFKQSKVAELHFQMLRDGMQFAFTGDNTGALWPNGLDMGDSIGFDAPTGAPATAADPVVVGPAFTQITFDDTAVNYAVTPFNSAVASIVAGPAGGNGKATKVTKVAGDAALGVTISTGPNASIDRIPFTATAKTMTLRVWAPAADLKMRMKIEDASDNTHNCETDTATTVANGWQTLTFNFNTRAFNNGDPTQLTSNRCIDNALLLVSTMNKVSVFPSFGSAAAAGDFYFDDLKFVP